jgi:N-acetylneuraminate synthase/sialic acid synthase
VEPALGDGVKRRLPVEEKPLEKMGKKLVAARPLQSGHVLAADDLAIKSPADGGLPPYELDRVIGLRLRRPLQLDESLALVDLESVEEVTAAHATVAQ